MPPPAKEAVVVIWDVGEDMSKRSSTSFDECKACIAEFCLKKIQFSRQDEVGVLLMGSRETHNKLALTCSGKYNNLAVLSEIGKPTTDVIKQIGNVQRQTDGGVSADLMDALVVAGDMIQTRCKKLRFSKRIFLFTSAGDEVRNKDDLDTILTSFEALDLSLVVVAIDFDYKTEEIADLHEDWQSMSLKQQNEKVLYHMVSTLGGNSICTPSDTALQRLTDLSVKGVLQRTSTRACLEFGEDLKIPLFMYTKTKKASVPTLQRRSIPARDLDSDSKGKVDIERLYYRSDDPEVSVDEENKARAYHYGATVVPFNELDVQMLNFDGGIRSLKVLAFVPSSSIRRHHFLSGTYCIATPPGDMEAHNAFTPLLQAMYETNNSVIVRLVRHNYREPVIAMAWPHITANKKCLFLNDLPFTEDLRKYDYKELSDVVSPELLQTVDDLIMKMDLETALHEGEEALRPRDVYNPLIQYFQQAVRLRLLKPDLELPPIDPKISTTCCNWNSDTNMLSKFFASANTTIDRLKAVSGVRISAGAGEAKKRNFWFADGSGPVTTTNNIFNAEHAMKKQKTYFSGDGSGSQSDTNPRSSIDKSLGLGSDLLRDGRVIADKVTTIAPTADFQDLLHRKDGDFVQTAISGMMKVIKELLQESIATSLHQKALNCLSVLRSGCVTESEPVEFNLFLRDLKSMCSNNRKSGFWKRVQDSKLTLITCEECSDSDISKQNALDFLLEGDEQVAVQAKQTPQQEEDDLFDALD